MDPKAFPKARFLLQPFGLSIYNSGFIRRLLMETISLAAWRLTSDICTLLATLDICCCQRRSAVCRDLGNTIKESTKRHSTSIQVKRADGIQAQSMTFPLF